MIIHSTIDIDINMDIECHIPSTTFRKCNLLKIIKVTVLRVAVLKLVFE